MKVYLEQFVCENPNKDCYYRRCEQCTAKKLDVVKKIEEILKETGKPIVRFKRWLTTDGTQFTQPEMEAGEFSSFITDESEKVLKHHYLSVTQHKRFKTVQNELKNNELLIWGDFSENYTSVTQNAIQSDYFNSRQITLHPFTVYFRKEGELKTICYCVISDCNIHDTNTFYAFQSSLLVLLGKLEYRRNEENLLLFGWLCWSI
jgi:hypothetical protein